MNAEENGQTDVPVLVEDPFELERLRETNGTIEDEDTDLRLQRDRMFYGCVVLFVVCIGLGLGWRFWPVQVTIPFVQPLQVDTHTGVVTVLDQPQPLKDFVVPGEVIQHMLVRFIDDWRRLGRDPVEALNHMQHVYAHLCGLAPEQIKTLATQRHAMKPEERPTLVDLTVPTPRPTSSPRTWTASWTETWSDAKGKPLGPHKYVGEFTVSRFAPTELGVLLRNRMGLCVSSFSLREDLP